MREFLKLIAFLVLLAVVLVGVARAFFINVVKTDSYSMTPALVPGDTFLVYTKAALRNGDVAVCRDPKNVLRYIVGRVMATPGASISITDDIPAYKGRSITVEPAGELTYEDLTSSEPVRQKTNLLREHFGGQRYLVAHVRRGMRRDLKPREVNDGLFLLGDNRNLAWDSRDYGEVNPKDCMGKAFFLLFPGPASGDIRPEKRQYTWIE